MGSLLNTLWRATILDDAAYEDWRERPNLFLRAIILIIVVSLVAGLLTFGWTLVQRVQPVDLTGLEQLPDQVAEIMSLFGAELDPEAQRQIEGMLDVMVPMIRDLSEVRAPLPRGIVGFFEAFGAWLTRALAAIGGWMIYGALVLIFVNLLGGSAKLPEFLGTVALYVVPGLLAVLQPVPCVGWLLALVGMVWAIVVYIKATSVAGNLDTGRAILAAVAPILAGFVLSIVVAALIAVWFAIIF